jgi:hypothetical protein
LFDGGHALLEFAEALFEPLDGESQRLALALETVETL